MAAKYRLGQWSQAIQERAENGESVEEFCNRKGISRNKYFYWQRKLRDAACEQLVVKQNVGEISFTEIKVLETDTVAPRETGQGSLRIEIGCAVLNADSTYPTEKLAALLRELARP